jgi:acetoin utilization deacetylase AcuC-like enzyme
MHTPIYYHPAQDVGFSFISVNKIPEFVAQSDRHVRSDFRPFNNSEIAAVHDLGYVRDVMFRKRNNGFGNRDIDVNEALRYTTAGHWAATRHALENGGISCSATQGFHHATWNDGGGYCTFNGLMISAKRALRAGAGCVLIIDGDGHYGNGTQAIIDHYGMGAQVRHVTRGNTAGTMGDEQSGFGTKEWYDWTWDLISRHKPGIIMYQAGADAWEDDPYGAGYLSLMGLARRDRGIFLAATNAGVPLVWNLAGGYADPMQRTIDIHLMTLQQSDEVLHANAKAKHVQAQSREPELS